MALLQKLKSILGLGGSDRDPGERREVGVTVEREGGEASSTAPDGPDTTAETEEPASTAETTPTNGAETTTDAADTSPDDTATTDTAEPSEATETTAEEAPADDETAAADLEDIDGIGPAYAQRLRDAGVTSVADLADADAEALAEDTDLSPNRIGNWIEQAKVR